MSCARPVTLGDLGKNSVSNTEVAFRCKSCGCPTLFSALVRNALEGGVPAFCLQGAIRLPKRGNAVAQARTDELGESWDCFVNVMLELNTFNRQAQAKCHGSLKLRRPARTSEFARGYALQLPVCDLVWAEIHSGFAVVGPCLQVVSQSCVRHQEEKKVIFAQHRPASPQPQLHFDAGRMLIMPCVDTGPRLTRRASEIAITCPYGRCNAWAARSLDLEADVREVCSAKVHESVLNDNVHDCA